MHRTTCYVAPEGKLKTLIPPNDFINLPSDRKVVTIEYLKSTLKDLKTNGSYANIYHLLEGSEIVFQLPPEEPRNPELHARVERLKAELANKEYEKMTKNLQPRRHGIDAQDRADVKYMNAQITAVLNFVFTVGGSFAFTYKAVEYALPQPNIPMQVLIGLLAAIAVAIADLYFLIRSL